MGYSPNQVYRRDGYRTSEHELEDQSFHYRLDENVGLYGVFDGHCGSTAATFVVEKMPAEILLGQLMEHSTEEEIREVLYQAFLAVEREYFSEIIGQQLAERTQLLSEIPDGMTPYDTFKDYPALLDRLEKLNQQVASGTSAVVALIFYGKLYVANAGDSRALLCRTDGDGVLRVVQLSVDHDLRNEDELLRLQRLDLNRDKIKQIGRIGNQENTRCLGNYLVKGGYKEDATLASAVVEPVIAEPEIHAGVILDDSTRFLVLLSDGLYKALEEASDSELVNIQLAQMIVEEFKVQSTLAGVAQAVTDKVSRMHYDYFMANSVLTSPPRGYAPKRDDMTLLVRNFNFPLPNSMSSPTNHRFNQSPFYPISDLMNSNADTPTNRSLAQFAPSPIVLINNPISWGDDGTNGTNTATTSTESSDALTQSNHKLPLDEDGRIGPYVDFTDYYQGTANKPDQLDKLFI